MYCDGQLLHHLRIGSVLIRIHDGSRFDTGAQSLLGYVARQSAPAGHIVEEVAGIIQSGYYTDLIVADPGFGFVLGTLPRFPRCIIHAVEPGPFEALSEVELVYLDPAAVLHLEGRQVVVDGFQRSETHEPGGLRADSYPLSNEFARDMIDEAFGISHPLILCQLGVRKDPSGLDVASDVMAGFALPPRSADPGRPVADALRASADGTCHVGDLVIGPDEFGIEDGLNRLDHRNSLFGRESGKKALHDLFDFSDVLLHDDRDGLCV